MADSLLGGAVTVAERPSLSSFFQKRVPQVFNLTVSTILALVLFLPLIIATLVIFISLWILSKVLQTAFKNILLLVDDKSFQLSVLVMTTLVGYYQIPLIPFIVYVSFFGFLLILKWLRGSECGILKDRVCYAIYWLKQEWIFRNLSVVGIKLHGCHPVTRCVFEASGFLFHEGTVINPEIVWSDHGVWEPKVPEVGVDAEFDKLASGNRISLDFPVKKGPLDLGDNHVYRMKLRYEDGLLRYEVQYYELDSNNKDEMRGCTDDFLIEMNKACASKFYEYTKSLKSGTALISVMDDMCHCEKMFAVAKLIKKGEKFFTGMFTTNDGIPKARVFCGVNGFKALL